MAFDPSRTELALIALVDAIRAVMRPESFPMARRNETLDTVLTTLENRLGEKGGGFVNVLDGESDEVSELLGADSADVDNGFECTQRAEIEWYVMHPESEPRDTMFDHGLVLIHDGIRAVIEGEQAGTLGGVVDDARVTSIDRVNPRVFGLPGIKAGILMVRLTFTSNRPF